MKNTQRKRPLLLNTLAQVQGYCTDLQLDAMAQLKENARLARELVESEAVRKTTSETIVFLGELNRQKDETIARLRAELALAIRAQEMQPAALKSLQLDIAA